MPLDRFVPVFDDSLPMTAYRVLTLPPSAGVSVTTHLYTPSPPRPQVLWLPLLAGMSAQVVPPSLLNCHLVT